MAKKKAARTVRKAARKAAARPARKAARRAPAARRRATKAARKATKKPAARAARAGRRAKPARRAATPARAKATARGRKRAVKKAAPKKPTSIKAAPKKAAPKKAAPKPAPAKTMAPVKPVVAAKPAVAVKPAVAAKPARTAAAPARKPNLDRPRKTVADIHGVPSSLDMGRDASSVRSGRAELEQKLHEHTNTSPALTAGDVDADWSAAESTGDEAPGGDNPTPDQDVVDEIGRALGVEYDDDEELQGGDEIAERDRHRWELDPGSSDDFEDR